MIQSRTPTDNL